MKAPAVLINANAGGVRKDPALVDRLRARVPAECVKLTREASEIAPALEALLATDCDTLMVVGGDGTAGATLSGLVRVGDPARLPRVALVGGGTVNTIARSLGATGRPDVNLSRWLRADAPRRESVNALLEVASANTAPHFGLIFGNGALCRWLELYYRTETGPAAAALTLARSVGSVLVRGATSRALFEPFEARLELEGAEPRDGHYTAFAASTVRDIGLGFAPFLTAGSSAEQFHWIETDAGGGRFAGEVAAQLVGWRERSSSPLRHAATSRVRIQTATPHTYTVDGDLFPASADLTVSAGPAVRFAAA